jgi:pyruvate/2-oxoglutarate dehydrogenase complex dihydrolipoamide dehydrogenase (E3) component
MKSYDYILIGTGQATGAILPKLLKQKLKIAVVESDRVGGSCVNWGCTPTKTLVASARAAYMARRGKDFGISIPDFSIDFEAVMKRVNDLRIPSSDGFRTWLEKTVDFYPGTARFIDAHTVSVGEKELRGEYIIIHTGTRARKPDILGIDSVHWLDNKGILDLSTLPEHLLVVGGSYVGLEFAQAFKRLGSSVTVFERSERLVTREDPDIGEVAKAILSGEGITFEFNTQVTKLAPSHIYKNGVTLHYHQNGEEKSLDGSHLLLAVGRVPNTDALELDVAGVETNEHGFITVDDVGRTSVPHIYALGDVNGRGAFTHTSVHDGQVFNDHFAGGNKKISDRIPIHAMYIDPPLARVGMSQTEAERSGKEFLSAEMDMSSVSRAKEKSETAGKIKVVVEKDTDLILGATVFGVGGDEIIGMLAVLMQAKLPYTVLQETVIPHPTVSELIPWVFDNLS